jgi:hypothetical protein
MQEELLDILKNGQEDIDKNQYVSEDQDSELTEEEFEEKMRQEAKEIENGKFDNEAEEVSGGSSWDDI